MTHVHYKFSSKRSYNTVVFDGVNITLCELKRLIMTREKLRATDCDLQITNGQTKEEYTDDDCPIPKGSSVIVRRVPSSAGKASSSAKSSGRSQSYNYNSGFFKPPLDGQKSTGVLPIFSQMTDLATAEVSEDFKIKTIMNQSCYDSSNYQKYATQLPANYTCFRCGSSEHHIRSCPVTTDKNADTAVRIKKSTGIPRSFMVKVDDPNIKGAMLTNTGDYAVPAIDAEAYAVAKKKIPTQEQQSEESADAPVPDELLCLICRDLLNDAVVIPCCGNSFCDDCIRSTLLDSEDHICPSCSQSDVSPDTLIANKFLRQAVNNFTKEQNSSQSFKSTPSASQSKDCTPRPSPAPTPPSQSQPEKSQVTETVISSESPPSSSSTSQAVVKVVDETPEKETEVKQDSSPAESPSLLISDTVVIDSVTQPTTLVDSVTPVVPDNSTSGSTAQCDPAALWERSSSASVSEGWTGISAHPPASLSTTFSLPQSPIATPCHIQPYLQPPLCSYPPAYSITAPPWTSGHSPQGAPIPAFTSSPTISPLLSKDLMLYHRSNQERTSPRGLSYNASYHYSSKTYRSKGSHSTSRSRSRSHERTRHHSPYSSHRGQSSHAHSSSSYSHRYKRPHSPTSASSSSHSQLRSRSPGDRHKSRHQSHYHHSSGSGGKTSRRRKEPETSDHSYDTYLRWKQEYTDWCEKYFHSYYSHFRQMPPPPLMPPPQPHWPGQPQYYHHSAHSHSPLTSDSRSSQSQSSSDRSSTTTTTHSSTSSYSDSTPTQCYSDSNSPQSDDCAGPSHRPGRVDEKRNKVRERSDSCDRPKSTPRKTDYKHKSKSDDRKVKHLKLPEKERERKLREEKEKRRHKAKSTEKTTRADADRSRQPGRGKLPDSRSDRSRKKSGDEETQRNQRQDIPAESPPDSDLFPKELEREKTKKKKPVWKPQPLTKENAWEGGVKVKPQKKINININLAGKKNEDDEKPDIEEANKTTDHTLANKFNDQASVSKSEEPLTSAEGIDVRNDSWEVFPEDEAVGGEDSDLWQCALKELEEEDSSEMEKSAGGTEEDAKTQEQEDSLSSERHYERTSMTDDNFFAPGQSRSVTVCEEQRNTVKKADEENMEKQSREKHSDYEKIPHSRRDRAESEREKPKSKVSSHHREVKVKTKKRLVEADYVEEAEADYSARLDCTMAPPSGRDIADSSFDFDRKDRKKAERAEEGRRHKDRESYSTLNRKSSDCSSQAFTAILDSEKHKKHRETDKGRGSEVKSRRIDVELDVEWKDKHAYSKYHYRDEVYVSWTPPPSSSSKTSSDATRQEHAPPSCSESSQGTALDPGERRPQNSRSERKKDKKKSHKKEKRHSPDEERKSKKKSSDSGEDVDLSKEYLPDKHT